MKTSVMEVRDMLSVLSALGVEKRIGEVPGVESATVNYAAGTATVRYDETRLDVADIKSDVRQSGFEEAATDPAGPAGSGHKGHTIPDAAQASFASPTQKTPPGTSVAAAAAAAAGAGAGSAGTGQPGKAASDGAPPSTSTPPPGADAPAAATPAPAGDGKKDKAP